MSTFDASMAVIEANGSGDNANLRRHRRRYRRRRRRRRSSMAGSSETTTDGSFRFSDSDSDQSWHSSVAGGSYRYEECGGESNLANVDEKKHIRKRGSGSVLDEEEIDLESGELELKVHHKEEKKDCRICHLSLLKCGGIGDDDQLIEPSGGMAIELGCSCKGDLAAAHKQCAETWFKIKGNNVCEICGATAVNIIIGGQANEASSATITTTGVSNAPVVISETQRFWHGRRIMNFLLACMIFAFVISWLFHFKIFP